MECNVLGLRTDSSKCPTYKALLYGKGNLKKKAARKKVDTGKEIATNPEDIICILCEQFGHTAGDIDCDYGTDWLNRANRRLSSF